MQLKNMPLKEPSLTCSSAVGQHLLLMTFLCARENVCTDDLTLAQGRGFGPFILSWAGLASHLPPSGFHFSW